VTHSSALAGCGAGSTTGTSSGLGATPVRPTSVSSAMRLLRRSFSAASSRKVSRSKRACASRVSVMVAVPTSKLRLAEASCSAVAALPARVVASASCAASTSK
jgi:hypothetical protein